MNKSVKSAVVAQVKTGTHGQVDTQVTEKQAEQFDSKMEFKDMRKTYVLRITGPCELHFDARNKWSKEEKGKLLGSTMRIDVKKGLDDQAKGVKRLWVSKGKKGFVWLGESEYKDEAAAKESV